MRNPAIQEIAAAFEYNCERAAAPIAMISVLIHGTAEICQGYITIGKSDSDPQTEDDKKFVVSLLQKIGDLSSANPGEHLRVVTERVTKYWPDLMQSNVIAMGVENLISSSILNLWTAFEAGMTDLWVTAVNQKPDPLGLHALQKQKKVDLELDGSDSRATDGAKNHIEKAIKLRMMPNAGDQIRISRHFNFNRLGGIRIAYKSTFRKGANGLFNDSNKISPLIALEGVRNVLIHNAGKADDQYQARLRRNSTCYRDMGLDCLDANGKLLMNGASLMLIMDKVVPLCKEVFELIDAEVGNIT